MKDKDNASGSFVTVNPENHDQIYSILKCRLPRSANLYNTAIMLKTTGSDVKICTYQGDLSANCWIFFFNTRKDYKNDISISGPPDGVVPEGMKSALINSPLIDWDNSYMFAAVDTAIAQIIIEISSFIKLNATMVHPCFYFVMDTVKASEISIQKPDDVELKNLKVEDVPFFLKNWKYAMDGSKEYIEGAVTKIPPPGIFKDGELVSAIILNTNGFIGMLHTLKKCRGQGLAQVCMRGFAKEIATMKGMVPVSTCEQKNYISRDFHKKIGMDISHECVFIIHDGSKCTSSGDQRRLKKSYF